MVFTLLITFIISNNFIKIFDFLLSTSIFCPISLIKNSTIFLLQDIHQNYLIFSISFPIVLVERLEQNKFH